MRPGFDEEHDAFRASFAHFLGREVTADLPTAEVFARAGQHGFLGMQVPEEYGGGGVDDPRFAMTAVEELMRLGATGLALTFVEHVGVAIPLLIHGADGESQARWLPGAAAGECLVAVSTDSLRLSSDSGRALVHGTMVGVVSGSIAGLFIASVVSDSGDECVALLSADVAGIGRSDGPDLVAVPGSGVTDVRVEGVAVSDAHLLVGDSARQLRSDQQMWLAVLAVSGARTVLDWTCRYVQDRKVFGRPIAEFENTVQALGGVAADIELTGSYVDACVQHRVQRRSMPGLVAAAKLNASELFWRAADQGLQLHGGYGYMREYPISQAFADARYLRLHGGSSEQLRAQLVADIGLLG